MSKQTLNQQRPANVLTEAGRAARRREVAARLVVPSAEDDAEITAAALKDHDNPPLAEGGIASFLPATSLASGDIAARRFHAKVAGWRSEFVVTADDAAQAQAKVRAFLEADGCPNAGSRRVELKAD